MDVGHDDRFSSSYLVLESVFLSLVLVLIVLSSQDRLGIQLFCHSIGDSTCCIFLFLSLTHYLAARDMPTPPFLELLSSKVSSRSIAVVVVVAVVV
jgi:hypothetical protein